MLVGLRIAALAQISSDKRRRRIEGTAEKKNKRERNQNHLSM
jgi:hypothetical protein